MKWTHTQRNDQIDLAIQQFKELTTIAIDKKAFYPSKKACSEIILIHKYRRHNNKDIVSIIMPDYRNTYVYPYKDRFENHFQPYILISDDKFDNLLKLVNNEIEIDAIKEWNKDVKIRREYLQKRKDIKTKKQMIELNFDGKIRLGEIRRRIPQYYVYFHKTKLTLHSYANKEHTKMFRYPEFTFKIKPIIKGYIHDEYVYNLKDVENEFKKWNLG